MPPAVRVQMGATEGGPNPLAEGALRRRPTFESRDAAYDNYASKPPLSVLDPDGAAGLRRPRLRRPARRHGARSSAGPRSRRRCTAWAACTTALRAPRRGRVPGHGRRRARSTDFGPAAAAAADRRRPPPRPPGRAPRASATSVRSRTRPASPRRRPGRDRLTVADPAVRWGCHTPGVLSEAWPSSCPTASRRRRSPPSPTARSPSASRAIDHLPEPPSAPATKGTLVHAALERLFCLPADERTLPAALTALDQAIDELRTDPEFADLALDDGGRGRVPRRRRAARAPLLRARGPDHDHAHRHRAEARGVESATSASAASSTASSSTPTAASSSPTTRPGKVPHAELRAGQARRRPLLRLPVRAALRAAPGPGPAALPGRARWPSSPPPPSSPSGASSARSRAIWTAVERACDARRLPAPAVQAVRLVRVPGLLPGLRWRSRRGRGRSVRSIADADRPPVDLVASPGCHLRARRPLPTAPPHRRSRLARRSPGSAGSSRPPTRCSPTRSSTWPTAAPTTSSRPTSSAPSPASTRRRRRLRRLRGNPSRPTGSSTRSPSSATSA